MTQSAATSPSGSRSRFLELGALSALANMRFVTGHQIEGSFSGRHLSRQKGGAGEFVDYREHSNGEDLRRLDWKVLARTGRAYTRLYQDETNLLCTMVLDGSESMRFGGNDGAMSKLEYAQYLSTALSHVISRQQDQVGLAVASDGLRKFLGTGSTPGHVMRIQETIERIETRPVSNLAGAMEELFGRLNRRGVLMIISDFLMEDLEKLFASVRLFRHRHFEVVLLHLIHPQEERLPDGLAYRFEGMENDGRIDCSPAEVRAIYEERFAAFIASVRTLALACGCEYRRVSTAVPYLQTLGGFLVERAG